MNNLKKTSLLNLYDLLHLFELEGPRIPRDRVLVWLWRVSPHSGPQPNRESMARQFERVKSSAGSIGVLVYRDGEFLTHESFVVINQASQAKRKVSRMLDEIEAQSRRAA